MGGRAIASQHFPSVLFSPLCSLVERGYGMPYAVRFLPVNLLLSDRCRPAADVTLPACLLFHIKNTNLADFDSQLNGLASEDAMQASDAK